MPGYTVTCTLILTTRVNFPVFLLYSLAKLWPTRRGGTDVRCAGRYGRPACSKKTRRRHDRRAHIASSMRPIHLSEYSGRRGRPLDYSAAGRYARPYYLVLFRLYARPANLRRTGRYARPLFWMASRYARPPISNHRSLWPVPISDYPSTRLPRL